VTEKGGALSLGIANALPETAIPRRAALEESSFWFAVQTKARHEKKVNAELREKGICSFLPLHRERRRWSDRYQWVELPMFSHYLFVKLLPTAESRVRVLQTAGVVQFVGATGCGTPIPNEQIESLHAIVSHCVSAAPHEFLRVGERVRIRGGVLEGIEGILSAIRNDKSVVVSVELIQKSVAIRIDGFEIERV
jgi:transcription antitermination factor NusG